MVSDNITYNVKQLFVTFKTMPKKPNVPMVIQASKSMNQLGQTHEYIGSITQGKQFCFC